VPKARKAAAELEDQAVQIQDHLERQSTIALAIARHFICSKSTAKFV
jgi:hypothetical protein